MRLCAVALASILLAAFAPEQGQNRLDCQWTAPDGQTLLRLSSVFTRIDDLFLVVAPVEINGRVDGQDIHRTFSAGQFKFDMQLDPKDNQRRLTLHTRNGVNAQVKWVIRDTPGTDGIQMKWPAELGVKPVRTEWALSDTDPSAKPPGPSTTCTATR